MPPFNHIPEYVNISCPVCFGVFQMEIVVFDCLDMIGCPKCRAFIDRDSYSWTVVFAGRGSVKVADAIKSWGMSHEPVG